MSSDLKSYVEKYLLNPGASFNVDDDGNQETKAQVVDSLLDNEKSDVTRQSVSKLRARKAALEAEKDPRYRGKKVLRKDLRKEVEAQIDPDLTKYFLLEDEDEERDETSDDESGEEEHDASDSEKVNQTLSAKLQKLGTGELDDDSSENDDDDEEEEDSEGNEEITKLYKELQNEPKGVKYINDGDFSKFADDFDDDEDEDGDDDDEEEEEAESDANDMEVDGAAGGKREAALKKFLHEDQAEEVKKGQAVKNELAIYDLLFEGRIGLQKVLAGSNQLPQYDTYKYFLREKDTNYIKNLTAAKTASKNLLNSLLHIQELLLKQNPETKHIISGRKPKEVGTESNEEITSSEDEDEDDDEVSTSFRGVKRKMKVEEYEEVLAKRHEALLPYRDHTINKWYEKTKLLSSHSAHNRFSGFEVSALQQLKNILASKAQLVRRTQMTGTTRGSTYHVLGKSHSTGGEVESEEYDTEIFDDTDFYTRALEEVLKAKVSFSDNMTDVSRRWIEIQNLRKKAKKKVDKKASKGRKIRYEVMSKLQQYMAPCLPPRMDDAAANTLFASLFGKSVRRPEGGGLQ